MYKYNARIDFYIYIVKGDMFFEKENVYVSIN